MSKSTATKLVPQTTPTYKTQNIKFGKPNKNVDYGFVKHRLTYEDPESKASDNDNFIKLDNLKVVRVYKPKPEDKAPKYSVIFSVSEKDYEFCKTFDKYVLDYVYENRGSIFDNGNDYDMEDLETNYKPVFKVSDSGSYSVTVSFPFNNPEVKNPVRIGYKEDNIDKEVLQSTDLAKKLGTGSVCEIFLHFTNLYRDDTDKFKVQTTIYKRINVDKYEDSQTGGVGGGGTFKLAPSVSTINCEEDIDMGNVVTNDNQGRSLKPRLKYQTPDGETKFKSISLGIKGNMRFVRMLDSKTNKTSFSVVYNPTDEEVEHFNAMNEYMKEDLLKNYGKYEKGKKITKKNLNNQFRGTVKTDDEGNHTMWFTVYARDQEDGTFDFCGNFKKLDGVSSYTNEEIYNNVFGHEFNCEMNIYFKHIWFGKYYSCKFNMGTIKMDLKNVEYDLDDGVYYDGNQSEDVQNTVEKTDTPSADDDLNTADKPDNSDNESEPSSVEDEDEDDDDEDDN